jgi:hypothetical protein
VTTKPPAGPIDVGNEVQRSKEGNFLIIRLPKVSTPASDAEFLRRVCLDVVGRTPTPLEMHYFLKDSDPQKHRKAIEKLAGDGGGLLIYENPVAPPTKATRAEEYVKEKLGKKQLSPEERQLVQKVLEFAEKERPSTAPRPLDDLWRLWLESPPKAPPARK